MPSKYVPPQLRKKGNHSPLKNEPRSLDNVINDFSRLKSLSTNSETIGETTHKSVERNYSEQDVRYIAKKKEADTYELSQLDRHGDLNSKETKVLTSYYENNSPVFNTWRKVREQGYTNRHIANFFLRKRANQEGDRENEDKSFADRRKRKGAFLGASVDKIFEQFYNYAIDIDNGVHYVETINRLSKHKNKNEKIWFLDFGFAPGGMSDLILNSCPNAHGVGVSLESDKGGNVYLPYLDTSSRFYILNGDVIKLARTDCNIKEVCQLPNDFRGFDFVIIGITIHQEWTGNDINELKDLLHFSQLYLAFKHILQGGSILMRMHMSLRLVDCHLLSLMLSCFDDDMSRKYGNLKFVLTKPFSTFSMRKTYWVLYNGFKFPTLLTETPSDLLEVLQRLKKLIGEGYFGYGWDKEKCDFRSSILMPLKIEDLLTKHGPEMISVLEKVWEKQVIALRGFMRGEKDILCKYGVNCRRRRRSYRHDTGRNVCDKAHSETEIIPEVLFALKEISKRSKPRLQELGFLS